MNKLRLDVDALAVDSFATSANEAHGAGTVHGNAAKPTLATFCDCTLLGTNPTCCPCTPPPPN